ncbi:MAG: transcriptional regulator PpsR [Sphingomonas sp.]|uniref:transcriptional regulator PpsR n=1 Tax=Sphingomonas sp. TaxID=28214 RepID=UPI0025CFBA68|nr:transcriptional regulator PpsR [Sphingomonas sp.]MBY0285426.1 transcriptional regulator PpsR [Sphingomonas sp.]
MLASLLGTVGDMAFVLDAAGVVLDVAISESGLSTHGFVESIGKPWLDTVSDESRIKVVEMIADACNGVAARWRQVNHPSASGDIPVRYLTIGLGEGRLIAIGRDMRDAAVLQQRLLQAQQSLERDYLRLRQAEARYRLLFDMATEPVLIVDAATRRIREANPAAHRVLTAKPGSLTDQPVSGIVDADHREAFVAYLGAAEAADDVVPVAMPLRGGGSDVLLSARLFRQARAAMLLVRIMPVDATDLSIGADIPWVDVVERMPDAFVLTDKALNILTANAAFIELAQLPSLDRARGNRLDGWLGRPGIDVDLMVGQLRDHGAVRNVASVLRGVDGGVEEIEVSAVAAPYGDSECYGFTIRSVGRRLRDMPAGDQPLPRSVEQLTDLVGRMSLKEIVRESTDLIERLCIEAALAHTSDNRASAAEILGVSRQSLYSKLHRHGLGNLVGDDS